VHNKANPWVSSHSEQALLRRPAQGQQLLRPEYNKAQYIQHTVTQSNYTASLADHRLGLEVGEASGDHRRKLCTCTKVKEQLLVVTAAYAAAAAAAAAEV